MNQISKSIVWGEKTLTLETGIIAPRASGAVLVKYNNTTVLCTAVISQKQVAGCDFLPLSVHYIEKMFAAGKIPGGYFRREGKPTEREILISRVIDRSIRPTFKEHFHNNCQIVCTLLSYDKTADPEIAALIGTSAALRLAGAPLIQTIGATRIAYINNELVLNPTHEELKTSTLDLTVAGSYDSVFMIESAAQQLSEENMIKAIQFAECNRKIVIDMIEDLVKEANVKKQFTNTVPDYSAIESHEQKIKDSIVNAWKLTDRIERSNAISVLKADISAKIAADNSEEESIDFKVHQFIEKVQSDILRQNILDNDKRIDDRKLDEIRSINAQIHVLPQESVHGSALFSRGDTQALVTVTLGSAHDEQSIEDISDFTKKDAFMLHYNFPPYSVGETDGMRGVGRREIGHGMLAKKALFGVMPNKEEFPYTIRVVSEITSSDGSSSMATVCGTSLSMMATGVPLKSQVAGIAMGLIKGENNYKILTDITGDEDHLGDMDFKVAGTAHGITALQMDIKTDGITIPMMVDALQHARLARMNVLEEMNKSIQTAGELSSFAPKVTDVNIPVEKIAELIGKSGVTIKALCEKSKCKIDIDDLGKVRVYSPNAECTKIALDMINDIVVDVELGKIYDAVVTRIMEFGAIVSLGGAKTGMVHISQISHEHIETVESVLKVGDKISVIVLGYSDRGGVKLSMLLDQQVDLDANQGRSFGGSGRRSNDRHSGGGNRRGNDNREMRGRRDDRGSSRRDDRGSGRRDDHRDTDNRKRRDPNTNSGQSDQQAKHENQSFFAALNSKFNLMHRKKDRDGEDGNR